MKKSMLTKISITLACTALLSGVVLPATSVFNTAIVYAETYVNTSDQLIGVVIWHIAENTDGSSFRLNGDGGYIEVEPGAEITSSAPQYDGYTLSHTTYAPPAWDGGDGILRYVYKQNTTTEQPKDSAQTVSYTVQMIDQDNKVLQSEVRTGIEGVGATISIPQLEGYLFRGYQIPTGSDFSGKQTEISFPIQKDAVITLRYQFTPPTDTNTDINTNIGDTQAENGQENDKQTDTNNFGVTTNKQDINSKSTNTITQPAPQQSSITENISSDKNQKADIKELPKTNSTKSNILSFVGVGILGMTAFIKRYTKRQSI